MDSVQVGSVLRRMSEGTRQRSALQSRNFRFFWLGQSLSLSGDRLASIALALYVTLELKDPVGLGLILGAQVAALAAVLLFGGVLADRFDRRHMIIATDLLCFVLHAITAWLILTGKANVLNLLIIEVGFGIGEGIYRPAFSGLLPQTVNEDLIHSAWGFAGASESASLAIGPALATALFFGAGPAWAFGIDALTFLVSAISLSFVVPRVRGVVADSSEPMFRAIRTGWAEVKARKWVWVTIASWSLLLMLSLAPWFVLGPIVAKQLYGSGTIYGLHETVFGIGMISGALLGTRLRPERPLRAALLMMIPWPLQFIFFGLGVPIAVLLPAALAAGAGLGVYQVFWESALAHWIPPETLSRVSSWDWMGSTVLMPLGFVLAGPLATVIDPATLIVIGGVIGGCCIALASLPTETRQLRRAPDSV